MSLILVMRTKNTIKLILRILGSVFASICFLANPVLCTLSFVLNWGIVFEIVFGIISFLEIGFLTLCHMVFMDDFNLK